MDGAAKVQQKKNPRETAGGLWRVTLVCYITINTDCRAVLHLLLLVDEPAAGGGPD